jgi:hypothetical protein
MKCLFILIIMILFIIIYSSNLYEGLKDHDIKHIENDPWYNYNRRDDDLLSGKMKRNGRYGFKNLFEMDSEKLFKLFDTNKDKIISKDELFSEESEFDKKFIDEYLRILETKGEINYHEFKEWHDSIIRENQDEFIVCPQKEKDKPLNAIIHIKFLNSEFDPYDNLFIDGSEEQNKFIKEIQNFTKQTFFNDIDLDDINILIPDYEFKIEPSVYIEKLNPEDDRDPLKYKYELPSKPLIVTYKIINIQKKNYELILDFIKKKEKTISLTINNEKKIFKDFIFRIELLGFSHIYQKNKKQKKYSYTFDNHCEWDDSENNESLLQYYNSSCKPGSPDDDECWNKNIPLEKMDSPKLIDPMYPYIDHREHKPILSYPLHHYPKDYIVNKFKKKLNDHESDNTDYPVISLFDLMDEHNDLLNDKLYTGNF